MGLTDTPFPLPPAEPPAGGDEQQTREWLVERMLKLGFARPDAEHAVDLGVDPRELARLLSRGCSAALAVRILA